MRILIEICLTVCEWIQDKSIQRAARSAAREFEKRTILTFLSQGAVGGAFGCFVLLVYTAIAYPIGYYSIMYLVVLPLVLLCGALYGAFAAVFVWLPGALLKRRLPLVARPIIGITVVTLLGFAFFSLTDKHEMEQLSLYWWLRFICVMGLPIGLMTGSGIRPVRTIVFGVGRSRTRRNFGSWLSIPLGFLLRGVGIFGLLEALMVLVLWISNRSRDWSGFPEPGHLPIIIFAILYFGISTYFSFRPQRKVQLLSTAIVLNLPLAAWIGSLRRAATETSTAFAYVLLGFMGLWAVYTLARLITAESVPMAKSMRTSGQLRFGHGSGSILQL